MGGLWRLVSQRGSGGLGGRSRFGVEGKGKVEGEEMICNIPNANLLMSCHC